MMAVCMFLFCNVMITVRNGTSHLFADQYGDSIQIMFGATAESLFQGTRDAISYWPLLSINSSDVLVVVSIPELLLLILARYAYGWVHVMALKKDLPRRRLKTAGATFGEFAAKCEGYHKHGVTSTRNVRASGEFDDTVRGLHATLQDANLSGFSDSDPVQLPPVPQAHYSPPLPESASAGAPITMSASDTEYM